MKPNNIYKLIIASFILLSILACNALAPAPTVTPSPVPPTASPVVLISQQVTLISQPFKETNQTPPFTITSQTPQLTGSDDPRVIAFNQRLNELVTKEVDIWRQSFLQNTAPTVNNGSTLDEGLPLLRDLAAALDYAHGQGVIHRDIKPSNVIIEPITTLTSGRTQRAILMDFGIARFITENTILTGSGDVMGTADYISPEQIHGITELDSRTDQYSFGVMTYQLLTGKKPFERNNTWE